MKEMSSKNINILPRIPSVCSKHFSFDPVTVAVVSMAVVGAATAGASAYSAHQESSAAKKAAEAQASVGMAQIAAAKESESIAQQTAETKLKAKQASKTQSILTAPGAMISTEDNTNTPTILGV